MFIKPTSGLNPFFVYLSFLFVYVLSNFFLVETTWLNAKMQLTKSEWNECTKKTQCDLCNEWRRIKPKIHKAWGRISTKLFYKNLLNCNNLDQLQIFDLTKYSLLSVKAILQLHIKALVLPPLLIRPPCPHTQASQLGIFDNLCNTFCLSYSL
jgi:hypothetical protein